ncbi:Armadillo repeat-containing protein 8 [Actinomortierella ambigua]|nr:Armadillo repeat-containing protein 8 [Actinomortierella ambigua]
MTLTPHELAVAQLGATQGLPMERIKSLRFIKNNIIGNKTKKDLYIRLGIVPRLLSIANSRDDKDPQLKIQAVIVLGSFAFGNESNILALTSAGAIEPLLQCLAPTNDPLLIEAAARTLNAIYASPSVSRHELFEGTHLQSLVKLLDISRVAAYPGQENTIIHTADLAASILTRSCELAEHQVQIFTSGAIPFLMQLLVSGIVRSQEAALDALAALAKDNPELARHVAQFKRKYFDIIMNTSTNTNITNLSMTMRTRTLLTYLNRAGAIPDYQNDVSQTVLPVLVRMLNLTGVVQETAPKILAYLIWESEPMQNNVCEMETHATLATIISEQDDEDDVYRKPGQKDKLKENSLLALAAISQMKEDCRRKVIETKVLPHIVAAMTHPSVGVRIAACQCTRGLSRSVKNLRTCLVDAGIEEPLMKLLSDTDPGVLSCATATLCNIVLDFSPMKELVIERGIVSKLVHMINYGDKIVRQNAVWALKNLVCEAKSEIKEMVMRQYGYPNLAQLLNDNSIEIQEQALNLVRNLACKQEYDIEQVFKGLGENRLMNIIEEKLTWDDKRLLEQALYILVNIATGSEYHKQSIVKRPSILQSVLKLMSHTHSEVRIATVWVVINLTWPDDKPRSCVSERVSILRQMGFEKQLRVMSNDHTLDVRDRVKTALSHLEHDHYRTSLESSNGHSGLLPRHEIAGTGAGSSSHSGGNSNHGSGESTPLPGQGRPTGAGGGGGGSGGNVMMSDVERR